MPNIVLSRIDERLIHGQVGVQWVGFAGANLVLVANDEVAEDPVQQNLMEMYGPMKSLVYRVKDRFRYNIFIKGSKKNISMFKRKLNKKLIDYKKSDDFRIVVDVDPINLI